MLITLAGLKFRPTSAKELIASAEVGRKFFLECEPDNPFDPFAVRVIDEDTSIFVGYVPKRMSAEYFRRVEKGEPLVVTLHTADPLAPVLSVEPADGEG